MDVKCYVYDIPGILNMRDLGGYASGNGKTTAKGRFIRSTALAGVDGESIEKLLALGLDCVIDLRSKAERRMAPDVVENNKRVYFEHIPMLDYIQSGVAEDDYSMFPESMSEMYISLLEDSKDNIKAVFRLFSDDRFSRYLFHCTAGKDRTGVIAMLLLGLAGVCDDTIIEDYSYTEELLGVNARYSYPGLPDYLFRSSPQTMSDTLGYINEKYNGVSEYLSHIGITLTDREKIIKKLITENNSVR